MAKPEQRTRLLLQRLDEIGESLSRRPSALALIGLGSIGLELERLDRYSDLDFFVIVQPGSKTGYLSELSWLSDIAPVAYAFKNTDDGYKLLFEDGVFCEFAVFEEAELADIPFAPGRIAWKAAGVDDSIARPARAAVPAQKSTEFLLGEALTNLYVGLTRDLRGETMTATRFIQGYAVDRVIELMDQLWPADPDGRDPFSPERRIEQRHPQAAALLAGFVQGYARNRQSALAILEFLEQHFEANTAIRKEIHRLCTQE